MTDLDPGADLRERIDRALTDLSAPDGLTAAALNRGHRLRRRRRVLTGASGAAAIAVVAALVVPTLDGGSTGSGPDIATDPPASPSATQPSAPVAPNGETPSPGPDHPGSFYEPPPGWWDAPSKRLAQHLEDLLPDGVSLTRAVTESTDVAPGEDPTTTGFVRATLAGNTGPGGFEILLYPPPAEEIPDPVTTTDAAGDEHTTVHAQAPGHRERTSCPGNLIRPDHCVEITGGGGVHVGRASVTTTGGITVREVVLHGSDGGLVYLATANSTDPKWGRGSAASAPEPPLTLDQLRAMALEPAWTSYAP